MKEKPLVFILENSVDVTGSLKSIIRSCSALSDSFRFRFLLPKKSRAIPFVEQFGFECVGIAMNELSRSWRAILLYFPLLIINLYAFRKIIKSSKASLIIANDFYNMLPTLYRLVGGSVPYLTYVRFVPTRFPKTLVNTWCFFHFRFAKKIIAVSSIVQKNLKAHSKVTLIYNELPLEKGYRLHSYDKENRIILYLSNYIAGKGLEYALQAFALLPASFSSWKLRFVGGDMGLDKNREYKNLLYKMAKELKIEPRVEWNGFTENVIKEYENSAVLLNFSDSESFSLTCIEAMYMGRPVIATRCGGPEEMISSGVDGELVEIRNIEKMVAALKKVLSNADLRESYAKRAHFAVSEKFKAENTILKLHSVYKAVISSSL